MSCKILVNNNAESILFEKLLSITNNNESEATALYSHFSRPSFIESFGDYVNNYNNAKLSDRTDKNGEPLLFNNEDGSLYYIDKNGRNVSFPPSKSKIYNRLDGQTIRAVAQYLGMDYLQNVRNVNLENFDLEEATNNVGLREFIRDKFEQRINELEGVKGVEAVKTKALLKSTLEDSGDFVEPITDFFKTLAITFTENNNDSADLFQSEEAKDVSFGISSFELDSKKKIKTITKFKLATLKDPKGFNPLFGEAYVNYNNIAGLLEEELNDNYAYIGEDGKVIDIGENLLHELTSLSIKRPELVPVVTEMQKNPEFVKSMVISFKNQRNHIVTNDLIQDTNKQGDVTATTFIERNISEATSYAKSLRDTWNTNFYEKIFGTNITNKNSKSASGLITEMIETLTDFKNEVSKTRVEDYNENHPKYVADLSVILEDKLGITVDVQAIDDLFDYNGTEAEMKITLVKFVEKLNRDLTDIQKYKMKQASSMVNTSYDFITHLDSLRKLSKNQAVYSDAPASLNIMAGDKRVYIMSNISYLKHRVEVWKRNPQLLLDYYKNSGAYQKGSDFMRYLTAQDVQQVLDAGATHVNSDTVLKTMKDRLSKINIGILTDLFITENGNTKEASAIQEMSFTDYLRSDFNKVVMSKFFRSVTQADKNSNFQMSLGDYRIKLFGGLNKNGNLYNVSEEAVNIFEKYVESEVSRMVEANRLIQSMNDAVARGNDIDLSKLKIHYHFSAGSLDYSRNEEGKITSFKINKLGNAFKSQILPELDYKKGNPLTYKGTNPRKLRIAQLEQEIRHRLYDENGFVNDSLVNEDTSKQYVTFRGLQSLDMNNQIDNNLQSLIREYIRMTLSDRTQRTYDTLVKNGIINVNEEGVTTSVGIDDNFLKSYKEDYRYNDKTNTMMLAASLATDYTVRSLINNIEYSKLFTGDMAYYKNMVDYKKRVPATYTDGLTMYLKPGDETFNIAVIEGVEIASPYQDRMIATYGEAVADMYSEINSTDAQAWITPQRWQFIMDRLGKWTPTHESFYNKMISGKPEQYTNEELKVAAAPVKGVYFGLNKDGSPTYLKYSQAVLTPMLVKNTPLQAVYDNMIAQGVDELITIDGVKVGSPTPSKIHDENGDLAGDMKFNVFTLSNLDWKMQQDLPVKTFKDTEVGSQIQKNIFAGLIHNPDMEFDYDGKIVTGNDIMNEITNEIQALSDKGLNKLFNEFAIDPETLKIQNVDRYYQSLIDELKSRDGSRNVIEALEKRMTIAGIPQARLKLNNVFASIVNKRIIKIKTNGGSFIQMSNFGLNYNDVTKDNSGVVLHPNFKHLVNRTPGTEEINKLTSFEPFKYIDSETGREHISPAGIFISGSFIAKYIPDYKKYTSEQLFGTYDENGQLIEKGVIDNRILESLVGYRIPNQGMASNDALQIVGILPEENGDTIVAYTGITTKTGSDFDIDKQYLMMPTYKHSIEEGIDRLTYVDEEGQEGYHENRLIQLYKSVLTNPKLIQDVMLPIDFEFLKTDIVDLTESLTGDTNVPFYHMDPIEDIRLMYDFRNGKAGVGQEANWMVDISRRGKLRLVDFPISWFSKNITNDNSNNDEVAHASRALGGNVDLDRLTAVNLIPQDLAEYREDMKKSFIKKGLSEEKAEKKVAKLIKEITNVKISSSMTAVLNGFVDIAKDPFITRGNWVTSTTNMANLLLRMGVHPLYVNAFMAQPILRDYTARINSIKPRKDLNREDTFLLTLAGEHLNTQLLEERLAVKIDLLDNFNIGMFYTNNAPNEAYDLNVDEAGNFTASTAFSVSNILKSARVAKTDPNYQAKLNEALEISKYLYNFHNSNFKESNDGFSIEDMSLREFRNQVKSDSFDFQTQKNVLFAFFKYQKVTKTLTNAMKVAKVDTDGTGDNILNMLAVSNLANNIISQTSGPRLVGFENRFDNTPLGVYYSNIKKIFNVVRRNQDLFNSTSDANIRAIQNVTYSLSGEAITDTDLIKLIESGLYQNMMDSFFNISAEEKIDLIKNLPERLLEAKNTLPNNLLISTLVPKMNKKLSIGTVNKSIVLPNSKRSAFQQDLITQDWLKLLDTDPQLAEDLIKYSFVTTGFNTVNGQFFTLIPNEYFIKKDINKFVRNYQASINFVDLFISNNLGNKSVFSKIKEFENAPIKDKGGILSYVFQEKETPLRYVQHGKNTYKLLTIDNSNVHYYAPITKTGITINGNDISEYGDTIADYAKNDTQTSRKHELQNRIDELLNKYSVVDLLEGADYTDYITKQDTFSARPDRPDVFTTTNAYLERSTQFIEDSNLINTNLNIKNGPGIFSNIFTATNEKGKIKLNVNKVSQGELKDIQTGVRDPRPLLENQEFATISYENWLKYNDNSNIPESKVENYNNLRNRILEQINNPESQLNKMLDKGAKFAQTTDQLHGVKYTTSTDVLAQWFADIRQDRMYSNKDLTIEKNTQEIFIPTVIFEEEQSSGYRNRTIKNASADATIAIAVDFNTAGERLTKSSVLNQNKKYIPVDANNLVVTDSLVNRIINDLNSVNATSLNIAGNGIYTMVGKYTQKQIDDFTYTLLERVLNSPNLNNKIKNIRSGGQTGFDEAGTKAGIKLGLNTLTLAPKGWVFRNSDNKDIYNEELFKARFNIKEEKLIVDELTLIDNKIEEIQNTTNRNLIPNLLNYRKEVADSQSSMFPITKEDVEEYFKKCLNI